MQLISSKKGRQLADALFPADGQSTIDASKVPLKWKEAVTAIASGYKTGDFSLAALALSRLANSELKWISPVLVAAGERLARAQGKENLEAAARAANNLFKVCLNDRNSDKINDTKKATSFYFAGLMLRIYFRLHAYSLAQGIIKAVGSVAAVLPPLEAASPRDQVVYLYYKGVLEVMNQKYSAAEETLTRALSLCPSVATRARETVLLYLVPVKVLTKGQFASPQLYSEFPRLKAVYEPLMHQLRTGEYLGYRTTLAKLRTFLVKRHLYLMFDTLTGACLLRLVFRTWKILGKGNRLKVADLECAFELQHYFASLFETPESRQNAVEFLVAGFIAEGNIKGYISHDHRTVVLSNKQPFPKLLA